MQLDLVILNNSDQGAADYLSASTGRMVAALGLEMGRQMLDLLTYTKDTQLSGQMLKQQTGNLVRSGMSSTDTSTDAVVGEVAFGAEAPYARMLHDGTRPHVIEARGRALAFQMGGQMMFRRKVNHPGTSARPFLTTALDEKKAAIIEGLREALAGAA